MITLRHRLDHGALGLVDERRLHLSYRLRCLPVYAEGDPELDAHGAPFAASASRPTATIRSARSWSPRSTAATIIVCFPRVAAEAATRQAVT